MAGRTVQWLRPLVALAEDLGLLLIARTFCYFLFLQLRLILSKSSFIAG